MACTGEKRATLHSSLFCVGEITGKQSTSFVSVAFLFNVFGEDSVPSKGKPTLVTRVRRNPGYWSWMEFWSFHHEVHGTHENV